MCVSYNNFAAPSSDAFFAGASDHMQGSQYTFRALQVCTSESCKPVLMTDEEDKQLLTVVYATSRHQQSLLLCQYIIGLGSAACTLLADADAHTGGMAAVRRESDTPRGALHCRTLL